MNLKDIYSLYGELSTRLGPRFYLDQVVINSSPEPRSWRQIRESWQDDLLAPKLPAFEYLAGLRPDYNGPRSFWDVLARGHDKSSLEGRLATSLLLCSRRLIEGYIIAADKDQGKLLMQAMRDEAKLNPWVDSRLDFSSDTVKSDRGQVQVVPADAGGAYGYRGNLFIFDEVTNWKRPVCRDVWTAVMSGREKRQPNLVVVLSNAGYLGSWQHEQWEGVQKDKDWATFYREGQLASWMPKERVDSLRKRLAPSEARRLFDNIWINAGEDADYLRMEECERCIKSELFYRLVRSPVVNNYIASIDYGPKRDRTVMTIGHMEKSGRVIVDRMDVYQGKDMPGGMVQPSVVRRWIEDVEKHFDPCEYVIDPAGMLSEIEWMRNKNLPVYEYAPRGGKGNFELAMALRAMVSSGTVWWYQNCGVVDGEALEVELSQLVTKVMQYGFRIDHTSTKHDDRAVSLGQLLVRASEYPPLS